MNNKTKLKLKLKKIESDIRIQKERNKNKKEINDKKAKNKILISKKNCDENQINKKENLEKNFTKKINELNKTNQFDFDKYIKEFKEKNIKNQTNEDLNDTKNSFREKLIIYEDELKKQLEEKQIQLKNDYDNKLNKELENMKNNVKIGNINDYRKINDENKEIENDYYNEINEIKMINKDKQNKLDMIIKNMIEKTTSLFGEIKNKELNNIKVSLSNIISNIKQINEQENKEALIDDYLTDLLSEKNILLSKYSSFADMSENDIKQNIILLQYFKDIIQLISKIISDYNSNPNKNNESNYEFINEEIMKIANNIMNNYRDKYEKEKNIKYYPFLDESLKKIMNLTLNDDNLNYINNNSIYGKTILNNNASYLNNNYNSTLNEINKSNNNINNNLLKSLRAVNSNNQNENDSNIEESFTNNIKQNQSLFSTQRQMKNFQPSSSPTKSNHNNSFLNKTYSNTFRPRYNINIIQPINEQEELNNNEIMNVNIPELPNNIVKNFNNECITNYRTIKNFLIGESQKIQQEQNNYYNKKEANNKLNILKESGEYAKYNYILDEINRQEDNKAIQYLKEIQSKSNIFDMIKNNCEENFNFILNYPNNINIVTNKLEVLVKHINDYNKHFNTKKYNINIFDKRNNIENILNNTFAIDKKNINLYRITNNNESLLNNTMNFGLTNNRLLNSTSKSTNFNSRFNNTFKHL